MIDMKNRQAQLQQMVEDMLNEAAIQGASAAEAAVNFDIGLSTSVRLGEVETIEHTRDQGMGVSVYFGHRKGSASTSDFRPEAILDTVRAACNIAKFTTEDPYSGLADAARMAGEQPDLDLYHPWEMEVEEADRKSVV